MKLAQVLKLQELHSTAAGTQATVPDSRSADEWIKKYLSDKQQRLNDLRVQLNTLLGPGKGEVHGEGTSEGASKGWDERGRGRKPTILITDNGWYGKNGFYKNGDGMNHFDTLTKFKLVKGDDPLPSYLDAFKQGYVRIEFPYNRKSSVMLEGLGVDSFRDALARLPSETKTVMLEWWEPKPYSNQLSKEEAIDLYASWRADRPSLQNQRIKRVATGGKWAVVDPDGLVISTWKTQEEAELAAYAMWKGITPSSTGATAGARVKKLETSGTSEGASKGWDERGRGRRSEGGLAPGSTMPATAKPVVLVLGGSFNPPHIDHSRVADEAARLVREAGYNVPTVVVAPTADKLIKDKLPDRMSLSDRTELSKLTFTGSGIRVTSEPAEEAEKTQGKLRRTQLADWAAKEYPGHTIINITGEDSAPGHPPGFPSVYQGDKGTAHEGYYYLAMPRSSESMSSTKIRKALSLGEKLPGMTPEAEKLYLKLQGHTQQIAAYGTSEGASKGWDKRGRGHLHTAAFGKRVVTALSEAVPEARFKVVGSVARQGYSRNDLDIRLIFKPAEDPGFDDEMHARFERALRKLGFTQLGQTDHGDVYTSTKARKLVIDFWFGEPTEDQLAFGDMAAVDVFSDPQLLEQDRKKFIKHPKPRVVRLADWLRDGDHRPSSAGSTAGTGGAGGSGS